MNKFSADRHNEDLSGVTNKSGASHLLTSPNPMGESICDSFIKSFNQEYNKIVENDGLRSASNSSVPKNIQKMNDDLAGLSFSSKNQEKGKKISNPFTNEKIQ